MSDTEFPSPWPPEIPPEGEPFVYRSVNIHEANLVAGELKKACLPLSRTVEDPFGQVYPMPVGPGVNRNDWWIVTVPPSHAREAAEIVSDLPVSHDPNPPTLVPDGFEPSNRGALRALAWIQILIILGFFLWWLLH